MFRISLVAALLALPLPASADFRGVNSLTCNAVNAFGFARMELDPESGVITSYVNGGIMVLTYQFQYVARSAGGMPGSGERVGTVNMTNALGIRHAIQFDQPLKVGPQSVKGIMYAYQGGGPVLGDIGPTPYIPRAVIPISGVQCDIDIKNF